MQEKCTNTHIYTPVHTHLMGGVSVSSNLWYEIFITTFCAQLQCHALCVVPGFDVRLVIRTHTISLTLGVKVFFPRWCPTSSALLRFSISLSVALSLLSLFPLLRSCLSSSSSFALSLLPHLPPPCLLHIKTHKQEQICDLLLLCLFNMPWRWVSLCHAAQTNLPPRPLLLFTVQ